MNAQEPDDLAEIIQAMRRDPAAEFQTTRAAGRLRMSSSAFIRRFRDLTGLSPMRFRAALRMDLAKVLLLETDKPVTEISLDVGYDSLGTFVRTFTELVGICPTRLRDMAARAIITSEVSSPRVRRLPGADIRQSLFGSVAPASGDAPLSVIVGLFVQGVPAGWPIDGCVIEEGGCFELCWPPHIPRATLMAAAFRRPTTGDRLWAPRASDLLVYSRRLRRTAVSEQADLRIELRSMRVTDPPVLAPLPLFLASARPPSGSAAAQLDGTAVAPSGRSATLAPV